MFKNVKGLIQFVKKIDISYRGIGIMKFYCFVLNVGINIKV